jgi:hypothetical protein
MVSVHSVAKDHYKEGFLLPEDKNLLLRSDHVIELMNQMLEG